MQTILDVDLVQQTWTPILFWP